MFVLLAYRFAAERAGWAWWLMLLFAYLLTALVQRPLASTVPGALIGLLSDQRPGIIADFAGQFCELNTCHP